MLSVGSMTSANAAGFEPPPIAGQPGTEHHVGKVIWAELVTPNRSEAERFYGVCLGGRSLSRARRTVRYVLALLNGEPVAGLIHHPLHEGEKQQPYWLTFIAVQMLMRRARGSQ